MEQLIMEKPSSTFDTQLVELERTTDATAVAEADVSAELEEDVISASLPNSWGVGRSDKAGPFSGTTQKKQNGTMPLMFYEPKLYSLLVTPALETSFPQSGSLDPEVAFMCGGVRSHVSLLLSFVCRNMGVCDDLDSVVCLSMNVILSSFLSHVCHTGLA
jgi:hypothetical protein